MPFSLLQTHLLVSAQIRSAAAAGIVLTVVRKGDPVSGAILLKINGLDGFVELFTQVWMDEDRVWAPLSEPPLLPESEADAMAASQAALDPDLWIVEVEDKKRRLWFPGKVAEA